MALNAINHEISPLSTNAAAVTQKSDVSSAPLSAHSIAQAGTLRIKSFVSVWRW